MKVKKIKPICDAMGIDVESQRGKINSDEILSSTAVLSTAVAADGKEREKYNGANYKKAISSHQLGS